MSRFFSTALVVLVLVGVSGAADLTIGEPAPAFKLTDLSGQVRQLSDFSGKVVVLEWTNLDCPFVKKYYGSGRMQKLQETYKARGVIWLTICSSASGKQGHFSVAEWKEKLAERRAQPTALLLDADGKVGRAYGAKTTPHMFVIGKDGRLLYRGAIDDKPTWDPKSLEGAVNYVVNALDAILAGRAVTTTVTTPYGCSVKY